MYIFKQVFQEAVRLICTSTYSVGRQQWSLLGNGGFSLAAVLIAPHFHQHSNFTSLAQRKKNFLVTFQLLIWEKHTYMKTHLSAIAMRSWMSPHLNIWTPLLRDFCTFMSGSLNITDRDSNMFYVFVVATFALYDKPKINEWTFLFLQDQKTSCSSQHKSGGMAWVSKSA